MDTIRLTIPAKARYLLTARLASSAIGARLNMTIGDVDDLKTAIAESCIMIIGEGRYSDISIEYDIENNVADCVVKGINECEHHNEPEVSGELSEYILEAITTQLEIHKQNDIVDCVRFKKSGLPM